MSSPFEVISKADLTWRDNHPYSEIFQDIYFSEDCGFLETEHVFIQANQLPQRWRALSDQDASQFVIAEAGFGTGLNFLITWYYWQKFAPSTATLYYYSCEKFPLSLTDLQRCLALWPQLDVFATEFLANYPVLTPGFHIISLQEGRVNLVLMLGDACQTYKQLLVSGDYRLEPTLRTFFVDAWFLDGFSPAKNEAMWSNEFFEIMSLLSREATTVATYSASSVVRERLIHNGFTVNRVAGFGNKKHMIVANFNQVDNSRYSRYRVTPWHVAPNNRSISSIDSSVLMPLSCDKDLTDKTTTDICFEKRRAIVLGGGLAGCFMAYALAKRGWQVTVIESNNQVGQGASGNTGAVLYPKFSAFRSPLTEFMLMAFLFAVRFYRPFLGCQFEGALNGILQFAASKREKASHIHLKSWLNAYPELGRLIDCLEASELAGVPLHEGGLFIPDSGWINSQSLCQFLLDSPLIRVKTNTLVEKLINHNGKWDVGGEQAEVLIIANGKSAHQFKETQWLPIKPVAGQMTFVKTTEQSIQLKIPLCGHGHLLPARQNIHALGATFHIKQEEFTASGADDRLNLAHLQELPINWNFNPEPYKSWGGVRAAAPDYLPVVGPVACTESFLTNFAAFAKDSRYFIGSLSDHYPGLYLCTGFGSRGLTSIPLAAEWLASQINLEPTFLPRTLIQALSPSRFLRQRIISCLL